MPRALLFDVFGTVVDWRTSLIQDLSTAGLGTADWPGLVDAWRAAYAPSMDEVRRGTLPWTNLDALHRASLAALAPRFGLTLDGPAFEYVLHGWHRLDPWPDSVPGLTRLKRRFIVGTLSNGNVALLVNMAKHAGLPWDVILCAEILQHYKPDPETYRGAAALLGLLPDQVMLCAAHNADLAAAQAQGLLTAFIPRPTEYGPTQAKDLVPDGDWTYVARSIEDLAILLE